MDNKSGIYFIINKMNNKKYIGSTVNFYERISKHKSDLNKKRHHSYLLQRAWDKYGESNFEFIIKEEIDDESILKEIEQKYLSNEECDYNIEKFVNKGFLGKKHSEYTIKLLSEKKKNTGTGADNPMYGKTKELHHNYGKKMPQNGRKGKEHFNYGKPAFSRKTVLQFDLEGNFINEFPSLKEASIKLDIHKNYISDCCKGKYKKAKGFVFKFKQTKTKTL